MRELIYFLNLVSGYRNSLFSLIQLSDTLSRAGSGDANPVLLYFLKFDKVFRNCGKFLTLGKLGTD